MSFASESGYTPASIATIFEAIRVAVNAQFGTSYTAESFVGSNHYKYYYALAQRLQENEIKTAEIFAYVQQYFAVINARILRPVATNPGIIEALETEGYIASVKPMILADAGKINICVDVDDGEHATAEIVITSYANLVSGTDDAININGTAFTAQTGAVTLGDATFRAATSDELTAASLAAQINGHATIGLLVRALAVGDTVTLTARHGGEDGNDITLTYTDNDTNVGATVSGATLADGAEPEGDYAAERLAIATLIKNSTAAGAVTQGLESESIVLTNGQSFDFKFHLPNRLDIKLRLTLTLSENNQEVILAPEAVKALLLANIAAKYRLGRNFEPQRYFTTADAPWCAEVLLEWSYDGVTWDEDIYEAEFDDLFETPLENITVVEE